MAYTTGQLQTFFTNANAGTAPTAAQTLTLTALANQNAAGTLTDAQALAQTIDLASDTTTAVSVETYAFFTGVAPSQAGLTYLNQAFVGTGAQAGLNGENRFIAQSVALALGNSAAKTAFNTSYGSLSITDATKAAYNIIIGNSAAAAAGINVDNAVAFLTSAASQTYYTNFVKANVPGLADADVSLAVKAAIVGEIMYLATTFNNGAGVGSYASATTNLIKDLADDGALTANNTNGINLFASYGSNGGSTGGTPGTIQVLTSGVDTLTGTANDDTFNAVIVKSDASGVANADLKTTLSALDTITGGAGVDTLNIVVADNSLTPAALGATTVPGAAVSGVENIYVRTLSSTKADVTTVNAAGFSGATAFISDRSSNAFDVQGVASGQAVGLNGAAGATAVALTATYATGASSVVLNLSNGVADSAGAGTATVNVTAAGVTSTTINSTGAANSVAGISVGPGGRVATLTVNASSDFTATGFTGFGRTTAGTATIAVNGNGAVTLGGITAAGANIQTLNITTGNGTLSTGNIANAGFVASNDATINVSGGASTSAANTGAVDLGTIGAAVKTVNASGLTSGGVALTTNANTGFNFVGGAGTDVVTIAAGSGAGLTGTINGGAGTDIIAFTSADITANLTALVSNFEILRVSNNSGGALSFDPTLLNGITSYQIGGSANAVTLTNLVANANVTAIASSAGAITLNLKDASGAADAVTLTLNNLATTGANVSGINLSGGVGLGGVTAGQVETLNIVSAGRVTGTGAYNKVTLAASGGAPFADANNVVVTGTAGVQITTGVSGHSYKIDASAAGPVVIVGTAAVTGTQTIITGASNDTVSLGANTSNVYTGAGGDAISMTVGGAAVQTIVYKAASDSLLDLTGVSGASGAGGTVNAGKMDTITGFTTGVDKLDISALGVTGALTAGVVDKGTVTSDANLTALLGTAGLFSDGISTRGLAQVHYGSDTFVIVDVNKNGAFDATADLVIKLVGTASIAAGDFVTTN